MFTCRVVWSGWRGCHYTGKCFEFERILHLFERLLFVCLSSPKCHSVQTLPLLNSIIILPWKVIPNYLGT